MVVQGNGRLVQHVVMMAERVALAPPLSNSGAPASTERRGTERRGFSPGGKGAYGAPGREASVRSAGASAPASDHRPASASLNAAIS
jgi:hypothetical protein